jgi:hypothetical protein
MTHYLHAESGDVIGYLDPSGKYLYSTSGSVVIASFDSKQKYMYKPDGSIYGYIDGRYLYERSGISIIGYFQPPLPVLKKR